MTVDDYNAALVEARGWQKGKGYPRPLPPSRFADVTVRVGIYFACLANGELDYVGSAVRPATERGLVQRVREHDRTRRSRWGRFWVLPLRIDTPVSVVRVVEGQIIDLLDPPSNRRRHQPRYVPSVRDAQIT